MTGKAKCNDANNNNNNNNDNSNNNNNIKSYTQRAEPRCIYISNYYKKTN